MHLSRSERLLLVLAMLAGLFTVWQLALFAGDSDFMNGVCEAVLRPTPGAPLTPEERAMDLFRWVSRYDGGRTRPAGAPAPRELPPEAPAPLTLVTSPTVIRYREHFRENCGAKVGLLAELARRAGLPARQLRLCDADGVTRHVVCEVRLDGRWCVFDPMVGLDFRRADGELATAVELQDPVLLASNARRVPAYDLRRWQFTHPGRLHFEKAPLIGAAMRRLAARLTGIPADELARPWPLEQPRLVAAGSAAALALLLLSAAGLLRRRSRARVAVARREQAPLHALALEPSEQD
jgi:hypothetical protein